MQLYWRLYLQSLTVVEPEFSIEYLIQLETIIELKEFMTTLTNSCILKNSKLENTTYLKKILQKFLLNDKKILKLTRVQNFDNQTLKDLVAQAQFYP